MTLYERQAKDLADPRKVGGRGGHDVRDQPVPGGSDSLVPDGMRDGCVDNGQGPSRLNVKNAGVGQCVTQRCYSKLVAMYHGGRSHGRPSEKAPRRVGLEEELEAADCSWFGHGQGVYLTEERGSGKEMSYLARTGFKR
jgi:hypothetical protein